MLLGLALVLVGSSWLMRRMAAKEQRAMESATRQIAEQLGLRIGAAGVGVLGGMRGSLEGADVTIFISGGRHLPIISAAHPALPADLLIPPRGPLPDWADRLPDSERAWLEQWRKAHAFRVRDRALEIHWLGSLEEIPDIARGLARIAHRW